MDDGGGNDDDEEDADADADADTYADDEKHITGRTSKRRRVTVAHLDGSLVSRLLLGGGTTEVSREGSGYRGWRVAVDT